MAVVRSIPLNMGCIVTVHLSLETIARSPVVQVASGGAVAYIAIAAGRVPIPGGAGVGDRAGVRGVARVGIRGMGSSNIGIGVVVTVSVAGVVRGIAVRDIAVRGVAVGSVGRGAAISVGGGGDHGVTGSSAHVHRLPMINAPLVLVSRAVAVSVSMSIGRVSITIRGIAISVGRVPVTTAVAVTTAIASISTISSVSSISSVTISAVASIASIATIAISIVSAVSIAAISIIRSLYSS